MSDCPFCERVERREYMRVDDHVVMFEPLDPVTPGHLLFLPRRHVTDAAADPATAGAVFAAAAWYGQGRGDFNLITSCGEDATQTVTHLHVHYLPRRDGDNLHLPWTGQHAEPLLELGDQPNDPELPAVADDPTAAEPDHDDTVHAGD